MNQAIASQLKNLSNSDILPWDNFQPQWKAKINSALTSPPSYFISPHNTDALATTLKLANEHNLTVMPCGSGSKLNWGGVRKNIQLVISTEKLNRIIEHAADDLTVTVEAGVKLASLQETLKEKGQFLPLDPTYSHDATLGGIVATADAGSWRQKYGGVRDMLLGISFIRADGEIAKAGGRVVKNVAGYDLMKLFINSYGTLGILSQLTFRVYPLPEASTTILLTGEKNAIATAHQTLLQSSLTPTAADLLSASLINKLDLGKGIGLIVSFQSILASVQEQISTLETVAKKLNLNHSLYQNTDELNLWQTLQKTITIPVTDTAITCKIGILPNAAVSFLDTLTENLGVIHGNSGLGRLYLNNETQIKKLRSQCEQNGGFLTILTAPIPVKQKIEPWGYQGNSLKIMQQLKQKFDPKNILNPNLFVGGI